LRKNSVVIFTRSIYKGTLGVVSCEQDSKLIIRIGISFLNSNLLCGVPFKYVKETHFLSLDLEEEIQV